MTGRGVASIRLDKASVGGLADLTGSRVDPWSARVASSVQGLQAQRCVLRPFARLRAQPRPLAWPGERAHPTTAPAFDFSDFDPEVRVQDDLYRHVNGRWLAETEIPADKPLTGAFIGCGTRPRSPSGTSSPPWTAAMPGSDEAKIADLYASFMDTRTRGGGRRRAAAAAFAEIDEVADPGSWPGCSGGSPGGRSAAWSGWRRSPIRATPTAM